MIKIKTKRIKENENSEYVGVEYKVKNTSIYEHLVLIGHLLKVVRDSKEYTKEEILNIVKMYL